jgi:hypothetical protein
LLSEQIVLPKKHSNRDKAQTPRHHPYGTLQLVGHDVNQGTDVKKQGIRAVCNVSPLFLVLGRIELSKEGGGCCDATCMIRIAEQLAKFVVER